MAERPKGDDMREIKFRAWNPSQKRMLQSSPLYEIVAGGIFPAQCYDHLMQYTGLKDKNGVEIYEGDILQNEYGNFSVFWRKEFACWQIKSTDGHIEFLANFMGNHHTDTVIGNIYENPGLLKK